MRFLWGEIHADYAESLQVTCSSLPVVTQLKVLPEIMWFGFQRFHSFHEFSQCKRKYLYKTFRFFLLKNLIGICCLYVADLRSFQDSDIKCIWSFFTFWKVFMFHFSSVLPWLMKQIMFHLNIHVSTISARKLI